MKLFMTRSYPIIVGINIGVAACSGSWALLILWLAMTGLWWITPSWHRESA